MVSLAARPLSIMLSARVLLVRMLLCAFMRICQARIIIILLECYRQAEVEHTCTYVCIIRTATEAELRVHTLTGCKCEQVLCTSLNLQALDTQALDPCLWQVVGQVDILEDEIICTCQPAVTCIVVVGTEVEVLEWCA